jgi:hypothetical protein
MKLVPHILKHLHYKVLGETPSQKETTQIPVADSCLEFYLLPKHNPTKLYQMQSMYHATYLDIV